MPRHPGTADRRPHRSGFQPKPPEGRHPPPRENVENSFSASSLPQSGQTTRSDAPRTSSSNLRPHRLQLKSNRGILAPLGRFLAGRPAGLPRRLVPVPGTAGRTDSGRHTEPRQDQTHEHEPCGQHDRYLQGLAHRRISSGPPAPAYPNP